MRTAGLAASVGKAALPARVLVALVFGTASAACGAGGVFIARQGALPAAVAVLLVLPIALVGAIAAAYVLAPLSRAGIWLDRSVPRLRRWRVATAVTLALWLASLVLAVAG